MPLIGRLRAPISIPVPCNHLVPFMPGNKYHMRVAVSRIFCRFTGSVIGFLPGIPSGASFEGTAPAILVQSSQITTYCSFSFLSIPIVIGRPANGCCICHRRATRQSQEAINHKLHEKRSIHRFRRLNGLARGTVPNLRPRENVRGDSPSRAVILGTVPLS